MSKEGERRDIRDYLNDNLDGFVKSSTSALRCILRFFMVR